MAGQWNPQPMGMGMPMANAPMTMQAGQMPYHMPMVPMAPMTGMTAPYAANQPMNVTCQIFVCTCLNRLLNPIILFSCCS